MSDTKFDEAVTEAAERLAPAAREVNSRGSESAYIELLDDVTQEFATELGVRVGTPAFEEFVLALDARVAKLTGYHLSVNDESAPFPLEPGARLTIAQVTALQQLERAIVAGRRMHVDFDVAEAVVHEFSCQAAGSCCCGTTRPLAGPAV